MYEIKKVTTFWDAMDLRDIRNECRRFFTRDQSRIGFLEQVLWWFKNRNKVEAFLVYRENYPIAFGVINENEVTGGVREDWRGEGIGRLIFSLMTRAVPKPAELEVLISNSNAWHLYESLGWEYIFPCNLCQGDHASWNWNHYGQGVYEMRHDG